MPKRKSKNEPTLLIWVETEILTDSSKVYNVIIGEEKFAASSEDAANDLAETIKDSLNENTDETVDICYSEKEQ